MFRLTPLAFLIAVSLGCGGGKPSGSGAAKPGGAPDVHDHSDHDRGKMKLADAGPLHAALTEKVKSPEGDWRHERILLEPLNPDFEAWELTEGDDLAVIAEFQYVLE